MIFYWQWFFLSRWQKHYNISQIRTILESSLFERFEKIDLCLNKCFIIHVVCTLSTFISCICSFNASAAHDIRSPMFYLVRQITPPEICCRYFQLSFLELCGGDYLQTVSSYNGKANLKAVPKRFIEKIQQKQSETFDCFTSCSN